MVKPDGDVSPSWKAVGALFLRQSLGGFRGYPVASQK